MFYKVRVFEYWENYSRRNSIPCTVFERQEADLRTNKRTSYATTIGSITTVNWKATYVHLLLRHT
jgi:hypothetical protein